MDDQKQQTLQANVVKEEVFSLPIQIALIELVEFILMVRLGERINEDHQSVQENLSISVRTENCDDLNTRQHRWFIIQISYRSDIFHKVDLKHALKWAATALAFCVRSMQQRHGNSESCFLWVEVPVQYQPDYTFRHSYLLGNIVQDVNVTTQKLHQTTEPKLCNVYLKVRETKSHMLPECKGFYNYIHKVKLLSPELSLFFYLNVDGVESVSDFCNNKARVCIGKRKLSVAIQHYLEAGDDVLDRIRPRTGTTYNLPSLKGGDYDVPLKLTVIAALVPKPLSLVVRNTQCTSLQVLLFGPGCIPLVLPSSQQAGVCPSMLVKLQDYGLQLDTQLQSPPNSGNTVAADWLYNLKPLDESEDGSTADSVTYRIQLFVIIDKASHLSTESNIALMNALRQKFTHMVLQQRKKFRKSTSTALNKILTNFTAKNEKQTLVEQCIPTISKAVADIVTCSTNEQFRNNCFTLMNVSDSRELHRSLTAELWDIAANKHDVQKPHNHPHVKKSKVVKRSSALSTPCHTVASADSQVLMDSFDALGESEDITSPHRPFGKAKTPSSPLPSFTPTSCSTPVSSLSPCYGQTCTQITYLPMSYTSQQLQQVYEKNAAKEQTQMNTLTQQSTSTTEHLEKTFIKQEDDLFSNDFELTSHIDDAWFDSLLW